MHKKKTVRLGVTEGNPCPLQEPQHSWGQHTRPVEEQESKNWAMSGIGEKTSRVSWNFWSGAAYGPQILGMTRRYTLWCGGYSELSVRL